MSTQSGLSMSALSPSFATPAMPPRVHTLQPGHSMLVSYPGSAYGNGVFVMANITEDVSKYMAFQVNGPRQGSLHTIINVLLQTEAPQCPDLPVLGAGVTESNRVFILTPFDWHPELTSFVAGHYRIHSHLDALRFIANGDVPEKMACFFGYVQGAFNDFKAALRDNQIGELTTDDSLIFNTDSAQDKWRKALHLHTGGQPLCIPPTAPVDHLPCDEEKPQRLMIN